MNSNAPLTLGDGEGPPSAHPRLPSLRPLLARAAAAARRPNPIWLREMRRDVRAGRVPALLMIIALVTTLVVAGLGSALRAMLEPERAGAVLFQIFFSTAYAFVTLVAPVLGATAIASERDARTWEAVLLTRMTARAITRGKLAAAYTKLALYLFMIAPVSVLCFIVGGISPGAIFLANVDLLALGGLGVVAGLAIGARVETTAQAVVTSLLGAMLVGPAIYFGGGFGLSFAAHALWTSVPRYAPVWLPLAHEAAPLSGTYLVWLVYVPLVAWLVPSWFFFEATAASIETSSADRSRGLKRWYLTSVVLLTLGVMLVGAVVDPPERLDALIEATAVLCAFLVFAVLVFAGEPVAPSSRMKLQWARAKTGAVGRFFGPGVLRTSALLLITGLLAIGAVAATSTLQLFLAYDGQFANGLLVWIGQYLVCAEDWMAFFVFALGLAAFIAQRTQSIQARRALLVRALLAVSLGPWILPSSAHLVARPRENLPLLAPFSPSYAWVMKSVLDRGQEATWPLGLGVGASCLLGALGVTSLALVVRERARQARRASGGEVEGGEL